MSSSNNLLGSSRTIGEADGISTEFDNGAYDRHRAGPDFEEGRYCATAPYPNRTMMDKETHRIHSISRQCRQAVASTLLFVKPGLS